MSALTLGRQVRTVWERNAFGGPSLIAGDDNYGTFYGLMCPARSWPAPAGDGAGSFLCLMSGAFTCTSTASTVAWNRSAMSAVSFFCESRSPMV